ncbi:hypothetical protein DL765_006303 [Monosporascus sp. GIB2]|nr:hypothetical protein DL765_006303 [Monosporascus sp. GIB2]
MARFPRLFLLYAWTTHVCVFARVNQYNCPLLGPAFPAAHQIDTLGFQQYANQFTLALEGALSSGNNSYGEFDTETVSFSIAVWSVSQNTSLYEYHSEGSKLVGDVTGGGVLNNNTIYRIGSISKLHTVYTYLAAVGDAHLDEPITNFLPELAAIDKEWAHNASANKIDNIKWSEVTLRSLAGQLSGIPRDYGLGDVAGFVHDPATIESFGLPPLDSVPKPLCVPFTSGENGVCTREEFFRGIATRPPVFAAYSTPSYSNLNYGLFAWALEAILDDGRPFPQIFKDEVLDPLGLNQGSFDDPSGAYYSTIADLNALGRSILRSELLPRRLTGWWLKPMTFTSDPNQSVGMPWEIYRTAISVTPGSEAKRMVDMYTKAGDVGLYATMLALVPDYGIGFTILTAGNSIRQLERIYLLEMLRDHFLPAFEDLNAKAAEGSYAGTYVDSASNSSITISTRPDRPGLGVENWISRGVNMLEDGKGIRGLYHFTDSTPLELRLQPTGLRDKKTGRVGFRLISEDRQFREGFLWECFSWASVDAITYGAAGVDDFIFGLDRDGNAEDLELRAFRISLERSR